MAAIYVQRVHENATVPKFAHNTDSGADATTPCDVTITPGKTVQVPLGIKLLIPPGFEIQGRPKSGLSSKGILVAFGTVDEGYRGELRAIVSNFSGDVYQFKAGDKVLQLVLAERSKGSFVEVPYLDGLSTDRGERGFGSTGA